MSKTKQNASVVATHERINELGNKVAKDVAKTAKAEAGNIVHEAWAQLLGTSSDKTNEKQKKSLHSSENAPRKADIFDLITFTKNTEYKTASSEKKIRVEAHMNYGGEIAKSSERANRAEMSELDQSIRQIQQELKQLLHTSKILNNEFRTLSVEETPPTIGNYYMKFFEMMLGLIRQAKARVEDSGAWLNAVKGKNSRRGYSDMSKKHGTSFTLSGERTTATQTG